MSVNERFRKIRENLKLTQEEMSNVLGSTRAVIGDIERGKSFPNPSILSSLHFKYNIDLNWLICGSGKMKHIQMFPVDGDSSEYFPDKDKYIKVLETNMELHKEIKSLKEELEKYRINITDTGDKK